VSYTTALEKSKSCGLEEWMWDDGEITWQWRKTEHGASVYARDPPLFDNFQKTKLNSARPFGRCIKDDDDYW